MRVLVTGANGFLGRVVCSVLAARGIDTVAAVRGDLGASAIAATVVKVGDLHELTDWRAALETVTAVIHLAARTHQRERGGNAELADYHRINVAVTRRLAEQAIAAGVKRFVFASSIKVNGERTTRHADGQWQRFSAADTPQPEGPYGQTKWAAERMLTATTRDTEMTLVTLRPPLVYGPGQRANLLLLSAAVARGIPLPLGSIENRRSLIYVENLADALVTAAVRTGLGPATYTLADCELSTPALVRALAAALGREPRLLPCPVAVLRAAGLLLGRRDMIERLTGSLLVETQAIQTELGWRPRISVPEALAETAAWYRAQPRA